MPKYIVRYAITEYYETEYDADSVDDAQEAFHNDENLWGTPYDSESFIVEIENEDGKLSYA